MPYALVTRVICFDEMPNHSKVHWRIYASSKIHGNFCIDAPLQDPKSEKSALFASCNEGDTIEYDILYGFVLVANISLNEKVKQLKNCYGNVR